MSQYLANELLDHAFNNSAYTAPSGLYFGFADTDLTSTDTGSTVSEPSGGAYARTQCSSWTDNDNYYTNNADVTFPTPTDSWGTLTSAFIADASSAGNILFFDNTITEETVASGDIVKILSGAFNAGFTTL